jgi:hypothetical protein
MTAAEKASRKGGRELLVTMVKVVVVPVGASCRIIASKGFT